MAEKLTPAPAASDVHVHKGFARRAPVLRVSARAAAQIQILLAKAERPALGVRLGIKKGGCAGMEYVMDYVYDEPRGEEMVEAGAARIFIAPASLLFLLGTEMDYEQSAFASGFVFKNPNQTDACGCGESVTLVPQQKTAAEA